MARNKRKKNKKSTIWVGRVHQPSSQIEHKMEWLDKIEIMLSIIASTFTGTIILVGDTKASM